MTKGNIEQAISDMSPGAAASELVEALKKLFLSLTKKKKLIL